MAKNNFQWMAPFKVIFRSGAAEETGNLVNAKGLKKSLIVTDKGVVDAGAIIPIEESLRAADVDYAIFDGVIANPIEATVEEGLKAYHKAKADNIIAVGGGSAMDTGKAIGLVITNGGKAADYDVVTGKSWPPKNKMPYFIAVPTTAGTGSEATWCSVITIVEKEYKTTIAGETAYADIALLDPELSVGLPSAVTAATGMDALTHAIECYVVRGEKASPMSDMTSEKAIRLIAGSLRQAVANGTNIEARGDMLLGSMLAGMSFTNAGLGLVHSLAHQLGAIYNIPHGVANAMILSYVMEYNIISDPQRFADVAVMLGENIDGLSVTEAAEKAVESVKHLSKDVGIGRIADTGIDKKAIPKLAKAAYNDINTGTNPRITPENLEDIIKLYEQAW